MLTTETFLLACTLVLALVQILLAAGARTRQLGLKWNAGPRDEPAAPPDRLSGRLQRAQANLFETLPLFAAAALIAVLHQRTDLYTALGAQLYFWGRVAYLPLYALGVPVARSLAWLVSLVGLIVLIVAVLMPA